MSKTFAVSTENFFKLSSKKIILQDERKEILTKISEKIAKFYIDNGAANINFICTHNSRRSQIAQIWSYFAANYFTLNINAFSGGTEVTSFNRNSVKTLQSAGFDFNVKDFSHQNPKYLISFLGCKKSILGFSKRYDHEINKEPYFVITTCNDADKNCPFIPTAIERFHLPFVDPKFSDGTSEQTKTYLETNEEIAAEVYYLFNAIKNFIL
ncbi:MULTISPECIES: low molecular weight phosphatase family protein [Polaribacter]|uniref:Protein-tyrosine-phosphatase n=1 Tax=Polaribacter marinaquae TaxID=1642819 RepID=A0ABZ2TRI1_9FLAO